MKLAGGLARFMGWNGPTLTDSGGFQVFSLSSTRKVDEEGVTFRSVYDGALVKLTPESVFDIQRDIGADIIYGLDECPPYPASHSEVARAVALTTRWAQRFIAQSRNSSIDDAERQAVFLIVQGGVFDDLRQISIDEISALEPDGIGIGGVSVGEPRPDLYRIAALCCSGLPPQWPRHLMGVGTPQDLLECITCGVDMFDCVIPTRNGRNGQAFTSEGIVNLRLAERRLERKPLDARCRCYTCATFTRSYLHHLITSGEFLGLRLISLHNIYYYQSLMSAARSAIVAGKFKSWRQEVENGWRDVRKID